jgi:DnaJ-domain-containing protein 1
MENNRIACPKCGKKIAEGIAFCPFCGGKQRHSLSEEEVLKNPYDVLQVSPTAEPEIIEAAYKSLARKYHPDSKASSASEERMREINWAYSIAHKLRTLTIRQGRHLRTLR